MLPPCQCYNAETSSSIWSCRMSYDAPCVTMLKCAAQCSNVVRNAMGISLRSLSNNKCDLQVHSQRNLHLLLRRAILQLGEEVHSNRRPDLRHCQRRSIRTYTLRHCSGVSFVFLLDSDPLSINRTTILRINCPTLDTI